MEKRSVTVLIGGQPCSFYSDDSDEFISALEQRANAVMKQTAKYAGSSAHSNAVLSVVSLTDSLLRAEALIAETAKGKAEEKHSSPVRKPVKNPAEDKRQVSVWDLLNGQD